jgi:cysteinyl-tRNA synthetase
MESDWPRKKIDIQVSRKNEARDKKNWGKKDAAREYLKPEESINAK